MYICTMVRYIYFVVACWYLLYCEFVRSYVGTVAACLGLRSYLTLWGCDPIDGRLASNIINRSQSYAEKYRG
jgi:hypothetical protein